MARSPPKKPTKPRVYASLDPRVPPQPKLRKSPKPHKSPAPLTRKITKKQGDAQAASILELLQAETVQAAQMTGMLPHEWMLSVMRGEPISHYAYDQEEEEMVEIVVLPTFQDRMECAKATAPYYAARMPSPKIAPPESTDPNKRPGVMLVPLADSMGQWADYASGSQAKLKEDVTK